MVAVGIHAMPKARMNVAHQLPVLDQPFQRLGLQHTPIIIPEIVEETSPENEEAAADEPFLRLRLLAELPYPAVEHGELTEARLGPDARNGTDLAVFQVKLPEGGNIQVRDSVPVSEQEEVGINVLFYALHARPGHGLGAGFGEGNRPVLLAVRIVEAGLLRCIEPKGKIAVHDSVVEEIPP